MILYVNLYRLNSIVFMNQVLSKLIDSFTRFGRSR